MLRARGLTAAGFFIFSRQMRVRGCVGDYNPAKSAPLCERGNHREATHYRYFSLREVQALADVVHDARDIAASISSGSFKTAGMVILPCSMKTLSGIVHSYTDGLLTRAADVVLKERRPLVLCVRETPFHLGHLRLLVQAAEMGAVIMPPVPAFYHRPKSLDDVINQTVNRVIDQFDISLPQDLFSRWQGA